VKEPTSEVVTEPTSEVAKAVPPGEAVKEPTSEVVTEPTSSLPKQYRQVRLERKEKDNYAGS